MSYLLYVHCEFRDSLELEFSQMKSHVHWLQFLLATTGRTPVVKGVAGHNYGWRRTPIKGCHYYLWWIPNKANSIKEEVNNIEEDAIFIRNIRHHDDTNIFLDFGSWQDYDLIPIEEIDPRKEDQKVITAKSDFNGKFCVKTIQGIPGSGKTVALHYAAKELLYHYNQQNQRVLYVTYTNGLKKAALDFFSTYKINENENLKIFTFQELTKNILKEQVNESDIKDNLVEFKNFLNKYSQKTSNSLRCWNNNERRLWIEIRAYLLGMALPFSWERNGVGVLDSSEDFPLLKSNYSRLRQDSLDTKARQSAFDIAKKIIQDDQTKKIFPEQYFTKLSLDTVLNSCPRLFENLQAIIVDEIQDFTLLQISLIKEIGKQAQKSINQSQGFTFILAGDESQTIVPSGFDWGTVKDMFYAEFSNPSQEYPLTEQMRSPQKIAKLISNSWDLYSIFLTRETIPDANKGDEFFSNENDEGKLLRWQIDSCTDWNNVFDMFQNYTDLAIIDLYHTYPKIINQLSQGNQKNANLLNYRIDQIKGLERKVIVILGLSEAIARLEQNKRLMPRSKVYLLENRNIIDEIRVALSRSIETLVIVENKENLIQAHLDLTEAEVVDWNQLKDILFKEQDIDDWEIINGLLQNAQESRNADNYEKAKDNVLKALEFYKENKLDDQELKNQIMREQRIINEELFRQNLQIIERKILDESFEQVQKRIKSCQSIVNDIEDLNLKNQFFSIYNYVKIHNYCEKFKRFPEKIYGNSDPITKEKIIRGYAGDYENFQENTEEIMKSINYGEFCEKARNEIKNAEQNRVIIGAKEYTILDLVAEGYYSYAKESKLNKKWLLHSLYLRNLRDIREKQGKPKNSIEIIKVIADRYEYLPPPISKSKDDLIKLLNYINDCNKSNNRNSTITNWIEEWLNEMCEILVENPDIYVEIRSKIMGDFLANITNILIRNQKIFDSFIETTKKAAYPNDTRNLYQATEKPIPDDIKIIANMQNEIKKSIENLVNSEYYIQLTQQSKEREKMKFIPLFDADK